jgi:YidC/Oxa1 family membrane protein insertase
LQIPIFFSLYQALIRSIELKGANFLWIKDLSQPDRLVTSPEINILPILMAITMFLQQKFTMVSAAGPAGEQQKMMTFLFPVLFGFIFYSMPSGLVLYWFVNSLLMFLYQIKIKLAYEPKKH